MNIVVELNITAYDFFNVIIESVRQDVGSEVEVVKGLVYEKKIPTMISGYVTAKVEVTEFVQGERYCMKYFTARSTVSTNYLIEQELDFIRVFYEETEMFTKKFDKWNANLMKKFYEKSRKNQLTMKLKSLESYVKGV